MLYTTAGAKCEVPVAPKVLAEAAEAAISFTTRWTASEVGLYNLNAVYP